MVSYASVAVKCNSAWFFTGFINVEKCFWDNFWTKILQLKVSFLTDILQYQALEYILTLLVNNELVSIVHFVFKNKAFCTFFQTY